MHAHASAFQWVIFTTIRLWRQIMLVCDTEKIHWQNINKRQRWRRRWPQLRWFQIEIIYILAMRKIILFLCPYLQRIEWKPPQQHQSALDRCRASTQQTSIYRRILMNALQIQVIPDTVRVKSAHILHSSDIYIYIYERDDAIDLWKFE